MSLEQAPIANNEIEQGKITDAAKLAEKLGRAGYISLEEVFNENPNTLASRLGSTALRRLQSFREELSQFSSEEQREELHTIRIVDYAKAKWRYSVYVVDERIAISFPDPFVNENMGWLLKGDRRRISALRQNPERQKKEEAFKSETYLLDQNCNLGGLTFQTKTDGDSTYFWINVPHTVKVK